MEKLNELFVCFLFFFFSFFLFFFLSFRQPFKSSLDELRKMIWMKSNFILYHNRNWSTYYLFIFLFIISNDWFYSNHLIRMCNVIYALVICLMHRMMYIWISSIFFKCCQFCFWLCYIIIDIWWSELIIIRCTSW